MINVNLGYFLIAILLGFAALIYFLLKYRKQLQNKDLKMTADEVWKKVSETSFLFNLSKSELIFWNPKDATASTLSLIVKDGFDQMIGEVFISMGSRKRTITMGHYKFFIKFQLTWNRSAILSSEDGHQLAQYRQTSWSGRHEIEVNNFGTLKSERAQLGPRVTFNYHLNDQWIGMTQEISSLRKSGRLALLPHEIPLEVRIFILTI